MEKARDLLESVPDIKVYLVDNAITDVSAQLNHCGKFPEETHAFADRPQMEKRIFSSYYSIWNELSTPLFTPNCHLEERMRFFTFRRKLISSLCRQLPSSYDLECPYLNASVFRSSDYMWIEYYFSARPSIALSKNTSNIIDSFCFLKSTPPQTIKSGKDSKVMDSQFLSMDSQFSSSPRSQIISCKFKIPSEYKSSFLVGLPEYNPYSLFNGLPVLSFKELRQTPQKNPEYRSHVNTTFLNVIEDLAACRRLRNNIFALKEKVSVAKIPISCTNLDLSIASFQEFRHKAQDFLSVVSQQQFPLVGIRNQVKFIIQHLLLFCGFEGKCPCFYPSIGFSSYALFTFTSVIVCKFSTWINELIHFSDHTKSMVPHFRN